MRGDRTAHGFAAVASADASQSDLNEGSQMRSSIGENLFGGLCGIGGDNFRKESRNLGYSDFPFSPRPHDFRDQLQSKSRGDPLAESIRALTIDRAERGPHGFPADPEAAAFIAKLRAPPSDTKHQSVLIPADNNRSGTRHEQKP